MVLRDITSAKEFAQACLDAFDYWDSQLADRTSDMSMSEAIYKWCHDNLVEQWRWPVYLVAESQYTETDVWIKERLG